jgi:AcrR family transcriptional regulator
MSRLTEPRKPVQERSRQRVTDIVNAALVLLREGGVERCSMAAIAAQAGLTPTSVYRYFPDSAAVIRTVAEEMLEVMHLDLVASLSKVNSETSARAALRASLRGYHRGFVNDRALRELWAGTFATPELVALNIADSRRNGVLIADTIAPWSALHRTTLRTRAFLIAHFTGAGISLLLETPPAESKRLLREMERLIDSLFSNE